MIDVHVGDFDKSDNDVDSSNLHALETTCAETVDCETDVVHVDNDAETACVNEREATVTTDGVHAPTTMNHAFPHLNTLVEPPHEYRQEYHQKRSYDKAQLGVTQKPREDEYLHV